MPRVRVKPKGKRPTRAPAFDELDALDQLFVRRADADDAHADTTTLISAGGMTVGAWLESAAGVAWRKAAN